MNNKHTFDPSIHYGPGREKIDWQMMEKTQLGMGPGESVVYHNRQRIIKVFALDYADLNPDGSLAQYQYSDALQSYLQWHRFWSGKQISIDPKDVSWGDLLLHKNTLSEPQKVQQIVIKTLGLDCAQIDVHDTDGVCVLKDVNYVNGPSLQSLCYSSNDSADYIYDTKDKRAVKVGAEQVYKIGYDISTYINNMVFDNYGIYCGKIMLSFTKYGYTALVPKNIKCTGFDQESGTLNLTITDWCSSIMLWYMINQKKKLFELFLEKGDLMQHNMSIFRKSSLQYDKLKHSIARSYVHRY